MLLLDICLESFLRTKIEQIDLYSLSDDDVISVAELALRSGVISVEDPGLANALCLWQRVMSEENRWSEPWARAADSALDYLSIALGKFMDGLTGVTQPAAERFAQQRARVQAKQAANQLLRSPRSIVGFLLSAPLTPPSLR